MNPQTMRSLLALIAVVLLAGSFATIALVPMAHEAKDVLLVLLGAIIALAKDSYAYFFGTSQSSQDKTALLATRPTGEPDDPVFVEPE